MKQTDVKKLKNGLYVIYWKKSQGGGESLAAVGCTFKGDRWIAPINWISPGSIKEWHKIKKVEGIAIIKTVKCP